MTSKRRKPKISRKITVRKFIQQSRNYNDPAYKKFRQDVYKRDGRICQFPKCNSKKALKIHHIKKWADYPLLRFIVSNGIVLCRKCHDSISKKEEIYERLFISIVLRNMKRKQDE